MSLSFRPTSFAIFTTLLGASGCAASAAPYRTPDHWSKADAYDAHGDERYTSPAERSYDFDSNTALGKSEPIIGPGDKGNVARIRPPEPTKTPRLFGQTCLRQLDQRGVDYVTLDQLKGVDNPVEVRGKLGGVSFYATDGRSLQMDCRLAIALDDLASTMRRHGVLRIRYSGAYVYRTTRSGRLSHHAHGLAIDLHDFETNTQHWTVKGNFERNVGCSGLSSGLNALSCDMRDQALFDEFLTPDFNADHYDHLHISVPRRGSKKLAFGP